MTRRVLAFQAAYYAVTGIWPIVSMRSFEAVTGPKVDRWLVKMVGALAASTAAALSAGLRNDEISGETRTLALATAAAFCAVDVVYPLKGRISKIYLADALVELAIIGCLLCAE